MHLWNDSAENREIFIIAIHTLFNVLGLVKLVALFQTLMLDENLTFPRLPMLFFKLSILSWFAFS